MLRPFSPGKIDHISANRVMAYAAQERHHAVLYTNFVDDLFHLNLRRLDDRGPAGKFTFYQSSQWLLSPLRLARNVAAEFEQTLSRILVIQRLVKRIRELVEDRLRRCPRSKQGIPG